MKAIRDILRSSWFLIGPATVGFILYTSTGAQEPDDHPDYLDKFELAPDELEYSVVNVMSEYSTLEFAALLLTKTGLDEFLDTRQSFTFFAPDDSSFDKLAKDDLDALLSDTEYLREVLSNHIVVGISYLFGKTANDTLITIAGERIVITRSETGLTKIGDAVALDYGIWCENGVIHVIDAVLMPNKGQRKG